MRASSSLGAAMRKARDTDPEDPLTSMGVAYVVFSQENTALYRVMTECSRIRDSFPDREAVLATNPNRPYELVRNALIASGASTADDELGLEITTAAMWCAAHGLAELADSDGFQAADRGGGREDRLLPRGPGPDRSHQRLLIRSRRR